VIDIVLLLFLKVEPAYDPVPFDQGDRGKPIDGEVETASRRNPGKPLSEPEQAGFFGGDGKGRDVVQPCLQWQKCPIERARLSAIREKVQRYRLIESERTGAGAA
jgi:hypothetical protein